jgi:hypothetical protein
MEVGTANKRLDLLYVFLIFLWQMNKAIDQSHCPTGIGALNEQDR